MSKLNIVAPISEMPTKDTPTPFNIHIAHQYNLGPPSPFAEILLLGPKSLKFSPAVL